MNNICNHISLKICKMFINIIFLVLYRYIICFVFTFSSVRSKLSWAWAPASFRCRLYICLHVVFPFRLHWIFVCQFAWFLCFFFAFCCWCYWYFGELRCIFKGPCRAGICTQSEMKFSPKNSSKCLGPEGIGLRGFVFLKVGGDRMAEKLSHWQAEMQIVVCACCYKFKMTMETLRSTRIQLTVQSTWSQLEAPLTIRTPFYHPRTHWKPPKNTITLPGEWTSWSHLH